MLRRGFLYWAQLDKRRPVLVLSPEERNARANDVIVAPLSTRLRLGPWHVVLGKGEGGVSEKSIIKCELIATIPRDVISVKELGPQLSAAKMSEVERAVLRAIGVPVPR